MRILVTGAAGFLGKHLIAALRLDGHDVVAHIHRPGSLPDWDGETVIGDLRDVSATGLAAGCDLIIHLAALSDAGASRESPLSAAVVNATGSLHLLEGARQAGAAFVLASSQLVYQRQSAPLAEGTPKQPDTPYGYSKLVAELWADMYRRLYGVRTLVVRFFSLYGPGQRVSGTESGVVSIFGERARQGDPLVLKSRTRRDFTHVSDAVAGIRALIAQPDAWGGVYNVATGTGTSLAELAGLLVRELGSPSLILDEASDGPESNRIADISLARSFGYAPTIGLDHGIRDYVRWLRTASEGPAESAPHSGSAC